MVFPPMLDTSGIDSTVKAAAVRKTVQSSGLGRMFYWQKTPMF